VDRTVAERCLAGVDYHDDRTNLPLRYDSLRSGVLVSLRTMSRPADPSAVESDSLRRKTARKVGLLVGSSHVASSPCRWLLIGEMLSFRRLVVELMYGCWLHELDPSGQRRGGHTCFSTASSR